MANSLSPAVRKTQETMVGMYSERLWPLNPETDEESGLGLKCLDLLRLPIEGGAS